MRINTVVKAVNDLAVEKGWYESERRPAEFHMLIVGEVAEATEEVRNGRPAIYQVHFEGLNGTIIEPTSEKWDDRKKPEGEAIELGDAVIRIMDYFAHRGWDLEQVLRMKHSYNTTRPHRHGGKKL